jgi:hypothetical protein
MVDVNESLSSHETSQPSYTVRISVVDWGWVDCSLGPREALLVLRLRIRTMPDTLLSLRSRRLFFFFSLPFQPSSHLQKII